MAINTDELARAFQAFVAANPDLLSGGTVAEPEPAKDPTPVTGVYDLLHGLVGLVAGADQTRAGELHAAISAHQDEHDELAKPIRGDDGHADDEPAAAAPVAPGVGPEV